MPLIDSHSHLDFNEFDNDRSASISRAQQANISHIIVSGTTAERWPLIQTLCEEQPICHAAYGLHPMFMEQHQSQHLDQLEKIIQLQKPVAVAEIGLDYFIENPNKPAQLDLFIQQLEIAQQYQLPVIIHARKSLDIILKQLRRFPAITGSIHSFSGSEQQAKQLINLGFYLSFGGPITYTRATRLRALVTNLPLESLLLETDSPDQPDAQHVTKRNEPAFLVNIAETIATLRHINVNQVAEQTCANAQTLFNLKPL